LLFCGKLCAAEELHSSKITSIICFRSTPTAPCSVVEAQEVKRASELRKAKKDKCFMSLGLQNGPLFVKELG